MCASPKMVKRMIWAVRKSGARLPAFPVSPTPGIWVSGSPSSLPHTFWHYDLPAPLSRFPPGPMPPTLSRFSGSGVRVPYSSLSVLHAIWYFGLWDSPFPTPPQWGAADAEVPSGENTELKRSPFQAWSRSVYSHACYAYCQGFLSCLFLHFQSIHLHFFQNLSQFFPVLACRIK